MKNYQDIYINCLYYHILQQYGTQYLWPRQCNVTMLFWRCTKIFCGRGVWTLFTKLGIYSDSFSILIQIECVWCVNNLGYPDKIQFCHLSIRFGKAWPNRLCLGPPPDLLSRPFASLNLNSDNCSHRQTRLALSGEALGQLSSTQQCCIWYNWEQNKLSGRKNPDESEHAVLRSRDDRLVEMAYLHADPVSILPLLKTAFILVAIDKKLIAVTSLWNRSLDTMG